MPGESQTVFGIDLGTTHSSIGLFSSGSVTVFPNPLGELRTPSVVAHDGRTGTLVVGRSAREIWALHPGLGAAVFKRDMGTDRRWKLGEGGELGPVELSALVLRTLREDAEAATGIPVREAVITVPAYFDETQRFATLKAGELAGLGVIRILNEPTAAAIAHGVHDRSSDGVLIVLDLGGGTFDVCIMDRFEGVLEVRSVAGDSRLGGEDFTRALARLALAPTGLPSERMEAADPEAFVTLLRRAEVAKRRLSAAESGAIVVPPVTGHSREPVEVAVTRAEAEVVWAPLLERMLGPIRRAFSDSGLSRPDVEEVLLVGGATRAPCVRNLVEEVFGRAPRAGVDPDLAVVTGAAIQGALQMDHAAVGDFVVTDVISHSLGVEVAKPFDGHYVPGYFVPLIHRNSVIPTTRTGFFSPVDSRSASLELVAYEGESRVVRENRRIGSVRVDGIPLGAEQRGVEVRFTYDLNGILEVEATVIATGRRVSRIFTRDGKTLSKPEIDAAAARLAAVKKDPRDRPVLRDLLARAEGLLREALPALRAELDAALDAMEEALYVRDEGRIREEARRLRDACERIDGGERW